MLEPDSVPGQAFASAFDAMPVALALVDEADRYVRVNPAFERLARVESSEIVGQPVGSLTSAERGVDLADRWARLLRGGTSGQELYLTSMEGKPRWLEADGFAAVHEGLHLLVLRDVTPPRRFRAVTDLLLDLALELAAAPDFRSAVTAILRLACAATDLPVGELWVPTGRGQSLVRAGSWERGGLEAFRDSGDGMVVRPGTGLAGRAMERGETVVEPDLQASPGFSRHEAAVRAGLRWGLAAPLLRAKEPVAILVLLGYAPPPLLDETVRMVSAAAAQLGAVFERKRGDEARSVRSAIVDDARMAVVGKTLDGEIVSWNRGAEELYGYTDDEAIGKHISILAPPDRPDEIPGILERIRRGETVDPYDTVRLRKDGRRVLVNLSVSPVRDAIGRLWGASAIARDVTRERQLEEEFRRGQRMDSLGRLAGGIAHDFNNLLTVVLADAEYMLDLGTEMSEEDRTTSLEEIHQAAERASSLSRQLLSFARQQAHKPGVVDLDELVRKMEGMLARVVRADIQLESRLQPDVWPVLIDPTHVEQVLVNLTVNARQAMPDGGRLTVETENVSLDEAYSFEHVHVPAGDYVLLTVTDTGHGMPPEIQERIFDPFFTTREDEGGTGLGLSTCYGIIRQAGGHIWVYSEPDIGTTFKIYLPRTDRAPTSRPDTREHVSVEGTETVLLVEDQPDVRTVAARGLRKHGYRVLLATSGKEALSVAEAHPGAIHIVVTDVVMPGMGGRELAAHLRVRHPEIPVLFMTGYADDEILRDEMSQGDVVVLPKPFAGLDLARRVRQILDG